MSAPDVAVIGGGIVGVAAATFLARAGAQVELFERGELASGASGRNSGAVQHPYDPELVGLHEETIALYRALDGFAFDAEPAGVLVLGHDNGALAEVAADLGRAYPELEPVVLEGRSVEPALAPGVSACRLRSGHPVRPEAATLALARAARAAGAVLQTDAEVTVAELRQRAGAVLVAAGPWTPQVVDPSGGWRPIAPVWA